MTPQQLIDLPYAGMAEKQLRKQGDWRKTKDEAIDDMLDKFERIVNEMRNGG